MSLFDRNIIEQDLGYDPDPIRNIKVQIGRRIEKLVNYYDQTNLSTNTNKGWWIDYALDSFMKGLQDETPPTDWRGPYTSIYDYSIRRITPVDSWEPIGFEIHFRLYNTMNFMVLRFQFN